MLISGTGTEAPDISAIATAPGLGLVHGMVVDSHFSRQGRIGRLMAAVAQNPTNLGLGIDEDTAVIMDANATSASLAPEQSTLWTAERSPTPA